MKQVFTLIEFEYDREVLPTEIQAAITKLLGVYPVKVERRPTKRAADLLPCGHPKSSLVQLRFGSLPYCEDCKRATIR